MMKMPKVRDMIDGKAPRYALAIAIAKRARELNERSIEAGEPLEDKAVNVAFKEFNGKRFKIFLPEMEKAD